MKATSLLQEIIPIMQEFDAGQLTLILTKKYGPQSHEINKKQISNKLNRLHCMGFVKRERVERQVITREGRICNRGYKYIYRVTKQGRKYARYMFTKSMQQTQQRQEESRIMIEQNKLFLALLATNSQLQISNTYLQMSNSRLQNELRQIQEGTTFGVPNTEWLRRAKDALRENQETITKYEEALSIAVSVIEMQREEISGLTGKIKANCDRSVSPTKID